MSAQPTSSEHVADPCVSEDELAAFAAGELLGAPQVEAHVDRCDRCRRVVSALAGSAFDEAPGAEAGARDVTLGGEPTEPGVTMGPPGDLGLSPGQRLGRFTVTRPLGRGAMGEVWAARDPELDRDVALKLLRVRAEALGAHATVRLRREAQAMARLNHPNVVAIYELGSDGDRVFCAMELVDGVTLREWLEGPRDWRQVLEVALSVGRGVAAAHAAGLIHRDIKPDNVLMARDGRTLVTDFGLAKLVGASDDDDLDSLERHASETPTTPLDSAHRRAAATARMVRAGGSPFRASGGALSATVPQPTGSGPDLTGTGVVIGTPAYMPPEQLDGGRVDAQSDQFSYCVTVYEALFGVRPFAGATLEELAAAMRSGPTRPARGKVPGPLVACLLRGLAADKQRRWPSMTALLDELRRCARAPRRRRIAIGAGFGVAVTVGLLMWALPADPSEHVRAAAESRISRAWGLPQRMLLSAAFSASKVSVAGERAATVIRILDAYRTEWLAMRLDAWAATHVRGEQNANTLERRLSCFDDLADEMGMVVRLVTSADEAGIARAPDVVHALKPISTCADARRLEAQTPPVSTPEGRAAENDLRELEALEIAGRRGEALARGTKVVAEAERLGEPSLLARATFNLGAAQANIGHFADAEATLRRALQHSAVARDHVLVAEVWLRLFDLVGRDLGRPQDALAFEPAVRAAVAQAGDDPRQQAELALTLGLVEQSRGHFLEAKRYFTEARDRHLAARGPDHPNVGMAENNLGGALLQLGELDEATRHLERSLEIMQAAMGTTNTVAGLTLLNLSSIAARRKDWTASERYLRRALPINLQVLGPDHVEVGRDHVYLARALREQHRFAEATAELAEARKIFEKSLPPTHLVRIMQDVYEAQLFEAEGKLDDAERLGRHALVAVRPVVSADNPQLAFVIGELARFVAHRSPSEALPLYDEALTLYTATRARDPAGDLDELRELASVALAARDVTIALRWFDRLPDAARQLADQRTALERIARSHK